MTVAQANLIREVDRLFREAMEQAEARGTPWHPPQTRATPHNPRWRTEMRQRLALRLNQ